MIVTKPRRRTSKATAQAGPDPERAIRDYVRAYVWRHGRRKTAEVLGVSRHTLWRFLERGHMGQAVPSAVLSSVGGNVRAIENARQQLLIDLMGLRGRTLLCVPCARVLRRPSCYSAQRR